MKDFSILSLGRIIGAEGSQGDGVVGAVSIDSRAVKAGDCFFAVKGENFDGHDYVGDAFGRGAVCAVVEKLIDFDGVAGKCVLEVGNTIAALGDFAREYRRECGFKVVAITGSVGKTTMRQITAHALSSRFRIHQSPKSFNNDIGVPLTLLSAGPEDEIVIAELGSNHPGEIANLTRIALPDIAVVTNVHPTHLEGFGDLATIVEEKLSISEGLSGEGTFIINGDIERLVDACRAKGVGFVSFGRSESADYRVGDVSSDGLTSRFTIAGAEIALPLAGAGNVQNAIAAWAVCSVLGLKIEDFAEALRSLPAVSMRAEVLDIGTVTVLNDCYNANPASMENALDILRNLRAYKKRRSVFICGDMAELGTDGERLHRLLGESIARAGVDLLITVGDLAQVAAESAARSAKCDLQVKCFTDARFASNNLHEIIKDYDIVLVKGSRSARLETAVEKLKELFS